MLSLTNYSSELNEVKPSPEDNLVNFTTKGQVVIPSALRRRFEIEEGARASITAATIRRAWGILTEKPGQKPLAEKWAEHKRTEVRLEDK